MAKKTKKPAPAPKKKSVGKPVKPAVKKSPPAKPSKAAKPSPKKSPPPKPAPKKPDPKPAPKAVAKSKPSPAAKPAPKSAAPVKSDKSKAPVSSSAKVEKTPVKSVAVAPAKAVSAAKSSARDSLRSRILEKSKAKEKVRPIAFSLDEIREIAKTAKVETDTKSSTAKTATKGTKLITANTVIAKPAQPHHIKAASLADILGFNPKKKQVAHDDAEDIPEKFRRYYKLLIELRNHLTGQIDTHSEETLKRSSKDDAGDLSSYGQHMADAGTDTFDRDFALSLVSSEQEALSEVEAAIKRIKDGTYGICENTQKPIAKERLLAVPFTRFSAEAQKDIERNRMRSRSQAGLFGELGEEGGTMTASGGSGDGDDE
ncbi:MAG TPA: TraR/DksA C4-type zinc finger protein [Rariglobus sp.]|nr:TraR/DksA C4-type zinc finger protein [Rariglobus sp.]